jgi:hypothetical protein
MFGYGRQLVHCDMITPREFIEAFLQEKTAAWAEARPQLSAVYSKYFGEPLSQHAEYFIPPDKVRTVIEDVKQSDAVASAVAREHLRTGDIRKRYRLAASGASWKIIGLDQECFCRRRGESGGPRCRKCNGEGWLDVFSIVP